MYINLYWHVYKKVGDAEIEKYKSHIVYIIDGIYKNPISINNIDINKITKIVPNKVSFGKKDLKYFIGLKHVSFKTSCI